jgi:hypothetical protein
MHINSAVDGQNYYVIKNDGLYLLIDVVDPKDVDHVRVSWGSRRGAAQWYQSMPDRVHVFGADGSFRYAWCVGLETASEIMRKNGGHLVYVKARQEHHHRKAA